MLNKSQSVPGLLKSAHQPEPNGTTPRPKRNQVTRVVLEKSPALVIEYLKAQCGALFRRGFSLVAHRERLYVRVRGTKIPLHLDLSAPWQQVQQRAIELQKLLDQGCYDPEAWRLKVVMNQGGAKALPLEELERIWRQRAEARGVSPSTYQRGHLRYIRRLDPRQPFGRSSLMAAIATTGPGTKTRRQVIRLYRSLAKVAGVPWNSELLDGLAEGHAPKKPTPVFTDEEIETIVLHARDSGRLGWWRALALMGVYGLRPWEAWVAEPSIAHKNCVWIPIGKKHSHGTTLPREVPPFHPRWLEKFDLEMAWRAPLPRLSSRSVAGQNTNRYLASQHQGIGPGKSAYGFRNAYARRIHSTEYRVTDGDGAAFMGHTVIVHNAIYRRWLEGYYDPIERYL